MGHRVGGLRPPEERYDEATLRAWAAAGGHYIFAANGARTAAPELFDLDGRLMVLFGRVIDDDYYSIVRMGLHDVAGLTREYVQGYGKVRELGGLYILSYHSQILSQPALVPVLSTVAREIAADTVAWFASGEEVADWWVRRHQLRLAATKGPGQGLTVTATNRSDATIAGVVVRVLLPPRAGVIHADGAQLLDAPPGQARFALGDLPAGASDTITLTLSLRGGRRAR